MTFSFQDLFWCFPCILSIQLLVTVLRRLIVYSIATGIQNKAVAQRWDRSPIFQQSQVIILCKCDAGGAFDADETFINLSKLA